MGAPLELQPGISIMFSQVYHRFSCYYKAPRCTVFDIPQFLGYPLCLLILALRSDINIYSKILCCIVIRQFIANIIPVDYNIMRYLSIKTKDWKTYSVRINDRKYGCQHLKFYFLSKHIHLLVFFLKVLWTHY